VNLPEDEDGFVWNDRSDEGRFRCGRDGDHLITIFQCDYCVFRILNLREPVEHNLVDTKLLCYIRRMNLDALWSRETSTVNANARNLRTGIDLLTGFDSALEVYPGLGPFPSRDTMGYGVALQMLEYSRRAGRYADYMQFETIRKLRSGFSNVYHASAIGGGDVTVLGGDDNRYTALSKCPTQSRWFIRFQYGCKKRMGQDVRPDLAMSIDVMLEMVRELEKMGSDAEGDPIRQNLIVSVIAYSTICYCGSLRGHEGFLVDLHGLRAHLEDGKLDREDPHVVVPLLGRFKNEVGERFHLVLLASTSRSGLTPRRWVEALVLVRESEGKVQGPAFCDDQGNKAKTSLYNEVILDALLRVQERRKDLIPESVDVLEEYGANRSFRRGSTTQAGNQGVAAEDIEVVNRWRKVERAKGTQPNLKMRDHYSEISQMKKRLLRYSAAL